MPCEFCHTPIGDQDIACNTSYALPQLQNQLGGEYTLAEIRNEFCKDADGGWLVCPAYEELLEHGRDSSYART